MKDQDLVVNDVQDISVPTLSELPVLKELVVFKDTVIPKKV